MPARSPGDHAKDYFVSARRVDAREIIALARGGATLFHVPEGAPNADFMKDLLRLFGVQRAGVRVTRSAKVPESRRPNQIRLPTARNQTASTPSFSSMKK